VPHEKKKIVSCGTKIYVLSVYKHLSFSVNNMQNKEIKEEIEREGKYTSYFNISSSNHTYYVHS